MLRWLFSFYRKVPGLLNRDICTLQDYSRTNNKDFSDLHFETRIVTEESPEIAPGSILIPDLNIIGARWDDDSGSLCDLHPDSPTINRQDSLFQSDELLLISLLRMPPVLLSPCDHAPDPSLYPCPVFRTSERGGRGNLAMVLPLPIPGPVTGWIERGVALSIEKQVRQIQGHS